ncbi:PrgI family protein [Oscillospiraceae bacterium OttesenSCG-928-G22]|nr:PrgI family protein [Oscillospiraceae bacterium OttesenSCG-928-G22]
MPYVNIPNDLSKIKTKMAFNLTKRQILCFGAAAAVGVPTYLLTRASIGNSAAMFLMIALMLPLFFLAMYERDGLPAEKVARNIGMIAILKCSATAGKETLGIASVIVGERLSLPLTRAEAVPSSSRMS